MAKVSARGTKNRVLSLYLLGAGGGDRSAGKILNLSEKASI
jgi:hypothetical protein